MSEISELKSERFSGRARSSNECSQMRIKKKDSPGCKLTSWTKKTLSGDQWSIFWEVQECFCSVLTISVFQPNSFGSEEHSRLILESYYHFWLPVMCCKRCAIKLQMFPTRRRQNRWIWTHASVDGLIQLSLLVKESMSIGHLHPVGSHNITRSRRGTKVRLIRRELEATRATTETISS